MALIRKIISPLIESKLLLRCLSTKSTDSAISANEHTKKNVKISDSCIKKLESLCTDGSFLRVIVEGGGCSGFQYKFDLENKINEDDISFGTENAKVVIDETSLEYCAGSTIDYHTELIKSGFRIIDNPKAEQGCSCGSSFAMKLT